MLFVWDYEFQHSPADVWPLIADTDQMYRAVGLPPVEFSHRPDHRGGSLRFGKMRFFGVALVWQEKPYEWIRNRYFHVDRSFETGPLHFLRMQWRLFQSETGCRLQTTLQVEAHTLWRTAVGLMIQFYFRPRYFRAYRSCARYLDGLRERPFPYHPSENVVARKMYHRQLAARFTSLGVADELANRLSVHILTAPFREISRMRPAELARRWQQPADRIFEALLLLSKKLFLRMSFELVCPACHSVLKRSRHLKGVPREARCDNCNRRSLAHLAETLLVTFAPNPTLRSAKPRAYCRGGPFRTPHFEAQLLLAPESDRAIELLLPAGTYRLRSLHSEREFAISVSDWSGTVERPICVFPRPDKKSKTPEVPAFGEGRVGLFLRNEMHLEILSVLERCGPEADDLPALRAISDPNFPEYYPEEAPAPGIELPAGRLAFFFATFTAGDEGADLAQKESLRQIVREYRGVPLSAKSAGQLFAFARPADAMDAALTLHARENFAEVRTVIHSGPASVTRSGDTLDFVGLSRTATPRLAAACADGEIVFTAPVLKDPGVREVLQKAGIVRFSRTEIQTPEYERPLPLFRHVSRRAQSAKT